jgi:hypothetical protein
MTSYFENTPSNTEASSRVTVITSSSPTAVNKTYSLGADGTLTKQAAGNILKGTAQSVSVETAQEMADILKAISQAKNQVLMPGTWLNDNGEPFEYATEKHLAELFNSEPGKVPGGVLEFQGRKIGARLRRGIQPSPWLLFDGDNPPGIPPEWAILPIGERLKFYEEIIPGISTAERIELRASSARVRMESEEPKPATHAWVRVNSPEKIPLLKAYLAVQTVNKGLSFAFERRSRLDREEVIGIEHRTLVDLSVLDVGRIVFIAEPTADLPGYIVDDANITIVNEGAGIVDIAWVQKPDEADLLDYKQNTGIGFAIDIGRNFGLSVRAEGQLTMKTEIECKGQVKTLSEWTKHMKPNDKLRCEAPFRESSSEAAFIRIGDDGIPFVHDIGNGTTYTLSKEQKQGAKSNAKFRLEPFGAIRFDPSTEEWLVDDLLPPEGLAVIYGKHKSYKSFVASDLALAVARGVEWAGKRVRQGAVVYICGEGAHGFRKRLNGYRLHHDLKNTEVPFYLAAARPNLGIATADLAELFQAINSQLGGTKPVLIVLDTLARMIGDSPENGEGMINFANNAEAIAERYGCLVIAVHHKGKNDDAGMRGHSSLPGAMVAGWKVTKTAHLEASLKVEDAKDVEDGFSLDVKLKPVELGYKPHTFEPVTTLVVTEISAGVDVVNATDQVNKRRMPPGLRTFVRELQNALIDKGVDIRPHLDGPMVRAVHREDVRPYYYAARSDQEDQDTKRKAFSRQLQAAVERELLVSRDVNGEPYLWVP